MVCWRNLAERAEQSLKKGTQVYVEGKLTHRTWKDQDGNNRRTTEIVSNYFRVVSGRSSEVRVGEDGIALNQSLQNEKKKKVEGVDDDLPF